MWSKNKLSMTAAERRHVAILKDMDCVICGASGPSDCHELEQGLFFASLPLCKSCHTGPEGWHGTRLRWTLRKMDPEKALDLVIGRMFYDLR